MKTLKTSNVRSYAKVASRLWFFGALLALIPLAAQSQSGSWTAVNMTNGPPFASTSLLLTDGTIMVYSNTSSGFGSGQWWRLTPNASGSYASGTWSSLASLPSGYDPLYFASAVLPDGRVLVEGGEYNGSASSETTLGAIYQPTTNTWTSVAPPSGWTRIGDGQSVVLPNGTFMLGNCCSNQQALFNASNLTWTVTGTLKADSNSEEGWTLLPTGNVLTVDTENGTESELYIPSSGKWSLAGSTGNPLVNSNCAGGFETGPAVLRPDGTVFALGGYSYTSIYNSGTGVWSDGPALPSGLGVDDGPAAILPNGNVLVMAAPYAAPACYNAGSKFFEFNGTQLNSVSAPTNAPNDKSYYGRMLVLPTGQIWFTDQSASAEIYTPVGTYQSSWRPVISSVPSTLTAGSTYTISGVQFNGLSQGAMYGDDAQMATNYPLVRITNTSSGQVFYARTHNPSTMGVATGSATVSTEFDVPSTISSGASSLVVVANGIPSSAVSVTISGSSLPSAPSNLTGTTPAPTVILLNWHASTGGTGALNYFIERCQGLACSNFSQIAETPYTTFSNTGLGFLIYYSYRVRAEDAAGHYSPYSNIITVLSEND